LWGQLKISWYAGRRQAIWIICSVESLQPEWSGSTGWRLSKTCKKQNGEHVERTRSLKNYIFPHGSK
jgi:hypothetical protein